MVKTTSNNTGPGRAPVTVAILFGGQSAEHEVSLQSAEALYTHIDKTKFKPLLIYISRQDGKWRPISEKQFIEKDFLSGPSYSFLPWLNSDCEHFDADIYFPMLHGPNGEDGKVQALLELADKPYVGASAAASAFAMDKIVSKILCQQAGLKVVDYLYFDSNDKAGFEEAVSAFLSYPLFVKPNAMGSSVGITKVDTKEQLKPALDRAFRYDRRILLEKALDIREIEVSVMGNGNADIMVSRPGELIPYNDYYDFNDKYIDGKTTFHMPARLEPEEEEDVREIAGIAYKALFLNGMSRVDLFIEKDTGMIYFNEVNTIPGFTEISMFPKLWSLQGISFTQLITRLIDYGFQYHRYHKADTARI
ncbi:MAG: D-alanine--D-alanine ligase [bacterium]|nr:D-alanine--D-alanine ligase [bacterium]